MTDTYHAGGERHWQIDQSLDTLRHISWRDVGKKLKAAGDRNRGPSAIRRDGYPAGTLGGGPAGHDPEALTSVERAANANLFAGSEQDDPLGVHVAQARALLSECAGVAAELLGQLELIDRLTNDAPVTREVCELCGAGGDLVWGTVGGLLTESHDLCRSRCYHFVRDNRGWPSDEQRAYFAEKGKWRVKIGA